MSRAKLIEQLDHADVAVYVDADAYAEAEAEAEEPAPPPAGPMAHLLAPLSAKQRGELIADVAGNLARDVAAGLVHSELAASGKGLRQIQRESGLQPAVISRVSTGAHPHGPELATLFKIALALGKTLQVSFVDQVEDDDD